MPWTGPEFHKHNHGLNPAQSEHAAHIANAILRRSGDEGMAIATANKMIHRDAGGMVDPASTSIGGLAPSPQTMNPQIRGLVQRYASLPTEKLQELNATLGASPYGQVVRSVLNQRLAMPNSQPQQAQQPQAQQPQQGMGMQAQAPTAGMQPAARGGHLRLASGGNPMGVAMSMADPWWTRQESYGADHAGGFLAGATPGRADSIKTQAPAGAYVIPADVMSGLGEGNSLAGARVVQEMLSTGPHGIPMPRGDRGRGPPRPPSMNEPRAFEAKGGGVHDGKGAGLTPVALSHGEFVLNPMEVMHLARRVSGQTVIGLKQAHRILDKFVVELRRRHIEKLKKLPGPVGADTKKKAA